MRVIKSARAMSQACRRAPHPLGLAPTMGALHDGHLSLVRRARAENRTVAVSIFVNPAQFGNPQDLECYPKDLERDLDLLRDEGVDLVFTPTTKEIYPPGFDTWVEVGAIGDKLEGAHRPGHFRGVATVVAKLFNLVRPDQAYFGQKDGQQTVVIQQMVRDLDLDLNVVVSPTVRQADGLALSSRNVRLTPEQREAASGLYWAILRAEELWRSGEKNATVLRQQVRKILENQPLIDGIDYVSVAASGTLNELDESNEGLQDVVAGTMVSVAVHYGQVRLIDNIVLE